MCAIMSTFSREASSEKQSDIAAVDEDARWRIRTLILKGQDHYEESRNWDTQQIKKFWSTVDAVIETANSLKDHNLHELQEVQRALTLHADQFPALCTIYLEFLMKYNTNESLQETSFFETTCQGYRILIDASLRSPRHRISDAILKDTDSGSVKSGSSRRSGAKTSSPRNSSASSVYLKSKAKTEAAKFKAAAQKEKAELNADLEVLAYEKEAAAADAEVVVLQSEGSDERTERSSPGIKYIASERTQTYVEEQSSLKSHHSVLQPEKEFEIPYMVPSLRNAPLLPINQIPEETSILEQAEIPSKTTEILDNSVTSDQLQ
ncbi:unnamed protein product [Mytilus coruscus]|uniref:Uncharacterized protein n=1 Tax=Mytilus coruscus TaxID=42192 RepID=A0A6J8A0J2_MYTCO|nr:unnamed protein product [Mytilus coruscus]